MRVFGIVSLTCDISNAQYDSSVLLLSKLGRLAQRCKTFHFYLLAPCDVSFITGGPYFTVLSLQPYPADGMTVQLGGYVPDPREVMQAVQRYGPDVLVVTHAGTLAFFVLALMTDALMFCPARVVLWDFSPVSEDTVEQRMRQMLMRDALYAQVAGYMAASHVWSQSHAALQSAYLQVLRSFGYAAADRLMKRARVLPAAVDREYMQSVVTGDLGKRDEFSVHIGGRWSVTKGYRTVTNVVRDLRAGGLDVRCVYTGYSPMMSSNKKVEALVESESEVISGLTQEEMWKVAARCHVGVMPQDVQALPSLPLEQLTLGLPVLVRSSSHLPQAMPGYPLVFRSEHELRSLLTYAYHHYDEVRQEAQTWWEQHRESYDIALLASEIEGMRDILGEVMKMQVSVSNEGKFVPAVPWLQPKRSVIKAARSVWKMTAARRLLLSWGYQEMLEDERPLFEAGESQRAVCDGPSD